MDKLNVFVLCAELELRVMIKSRLESENAELSGYADFDETGKLKIQGMSPDIVLCICKGVPSDEIYSYIHTLLCEVGGCAAVLMTDSMDVNVVNKAAESGIRRVLPLDAPSAKIMYELNRVFTLEWERLVDTNSTKKVRSKVLSFAGGKGGTGKTTVASNIASSLSLSGKRVILIDLDLQFGDVALMLDLEPKETIVDLVRDRGEITIENINNYALVHNTGMSVLCAPQSPEYAEYVTPQHIERIINTCRLYFEYIILDLPSNLNDIAISGCENSDEIMLIYNMDILSLKNAKSYITVLSQLSQKDKARLILNKCHKGIIKPEDFERILDTPLYGSILMDVKSVISSVNNGQPLVAALPHSAVAKELEATALQIMLDHKDTAVINEIPKKSKSIIGRLKSGSARQSLHQ